MFLVSLLKHVALKSYEYRIRVYVKSIISLIKGTTNYYFNIIMSIVKRCVFIKFVYLYKYCHRNNVAHTYHNILYCGTFHTVLMLNIYNLLKFNLYFLFGFKYNFQLLLIFLFVQCCYSLTK